VSTPARGCVVSSGRGCRLASCRCARLVSRLWWCRLRASVRPAHICARLACGRCGMCAARMRLGMLRARVVLVLCVSCEALLRACGCNSAVTQGIQAPLPPCLSPLIPFARVCHQARQLLAIAVCALWFVWPCSLRSHFSCAWHTLRRMWMGIGRGCCDSGGCLYVVPLFVVADGHIYQRHHQRSVLCTATCNQ
jgi:hypothetical protein